MVLAVLLLAPLLQDSPVSVSKGFDLYQSCLQNIRLQDHADDNSYEEIDQSDVCSNFIAGFVSGASVSRHVCAPDTTPPRTIARLYVAYLRSHPKEMDKGRTQALFDALKDAYPCSAGK